MTPPLRITLSVPRLSLAPGGGESLTVTIVNASQVVEHYAVSVLGLPPGASAVAEPAVTKLRPNETGTVTIRVTLPTAPAPRAGETVLGVRASSPYRPEVSRAEE